MLRPRCIQVLLAFIMAASGLTLACRTLPDQGFTLKDTVLSSGDPGHQELAAECTGVWTLFLSFKRHDLLNDIEITSGAVGPNIPGSPGSLETNGQWFIEYQRRGAQIVLAGLCLKDPEYLNLALSIFKWGFDRQAADGSFAGSGAVFHSTTFFVEAVAHSILMVRASDDVSSEIKARFDAMIPPLSRAAAWMIKPEVLLPGLEGNDAFTHRRLLIADGLGLTSLLITDQRLAGYLRATASQQISEALDSQRPDGVAPEKGGYDSSYQTVGMGFAAVWWVYFQNDPLASAVKGFLDKGLTWEMSRVLPTGEVDKTGNTRVTGVGEVGRTGKPKDIDYPRVAHALGMWGALSGNHEMSAVAKKVCHFKYPDRCPGT